MAYDVEAELRERIRQKVENGYTGNPPYCRYCGNSRAETHVRYCQILEAEQLLEVRA